jgi:hypothetical protein
LVAQGRAANDRWQQTESNKIVRFFAAATARPTKPKKSTRLQNCVVYHNHGKFSRWLDVRLLGGNDPG